MRTIVISISISYIKNKIAANITKNKVNFWLSYRACLKAEIISWVLIWSSFSEDYLRTIIVKMKKMNIKNYKRKLKWSNGKLYSFHIFLATT